jgi:predicted metal-dependent phosphotriesterase family hydrolase
MASVETVRGPVEPGDVLPALLEAGVTQAQLDTMLIENPVRYFTPAGNGAA